MSLSERDIKEVVEKQRIDSKFSDYPLRLDITYKHEDDLEHDRHYDEGWIVKVSTMANGEKHLREIICSDNESHQVLSNKVHEAVEDMKQYLWEEYVSGDSE